MPTADQIERRLWLAADYRAAQSNLDIAPDCAAHLRSFIRSGVDRIVAEGHNNDNLRISLAETNIRGFTMRMIIEARQINVPQLHEPTFFAAKNALCPLWPFC